MFAALVALHSTVGHARRLSDAEIDCVAAKQHAAAPGRLRNDRNVRGRTNQEKETTSWKTIRTGTAYRFSFFPFPSFRVPSLSSALSPTGAG